MNRTPSSVIVRSAAVVRAALISPVSADSVAALCVPRSKRPVRVRVGAGWLFGLVMASASTLSIVNPSIANAADINVTSPTSGTVPKGICSAEVYVVGGDGHLADTGVGGFSGNGGWGARLRGTFPAYAGQPYAILFAKGGAPGPDLGLGNTGGRGGDAAAVSFNGTVVIAAGGGGGAGGVSGISIYAENGFSGGGAGYTPVQPGVLLGVNGEDFSPYSFSNDGQGGFSNGKGGYGHAEASPGKNGTAAPASIGAGGAGGAGDPGTLLTPSGPSGGGGGAGYNTGAGGGGGANNGNDAADPKNQAGAGGGGNSFIGPTATGWDDVFSNKTNYVASATITWLLCPVPTTTTTLAPVTTTTTKLAPVTTTTLAPVTTTTLAPVTTTTLAPVTTTTVVPETTTTVGPVTTTTMVTPETTTTVVPITTTTTVVPETTTTTTPGSLTKEPPSGSVPLVTTTTSAPLVTTTTAVPLVFEPIVPKDSSGEVVPTVPAAVPVPTPAVVPTPAPAVAPVPVPVVSDGAVIDSAVKVLGLNLSAKEIPEAAPAVATAPSDETLAYTGTSRSVGLSVVGFGLLALGVLVVVTSRLRAARTR